MREADNFNHAILPQAIDHDMSGASYPLLLDDPMTPQAERVKSDIGNSWHFQGTGYGEGGADDGEHGPHQQVVAFGSVNAKLAGTLEQDAIDVGFGTGKQPVTQCPSGSLANRARRRSMADSCSAWLSSGVMTSA